MDGLLIHRRPMTGAGAPFTDRSGGFNYGRALPLPHDGSLPGYDAAEAYSDHLRRLTAEVSAASWDLDMALREVQHATNTNERGRALAALLVARGRVHVAVTQALRKFSHDGGDNEE